MLSDRSTKASKEIKDSSRERTALIYNRNKKEKREKLVLIKQIRIDYGKCLIECNRERKRCNNKKRRMEILRKSTYFHINDKYQYRLYSKNKPKFQKNCLQIIFSRSVFSLFGLPIGTFRQMCHSNGVGKIER